jgi:hypothetical protein
MKKQDKKSLAVQAGFLGLIFLITVASCINMIWGE